MEEQMQTVEIIKQPGQTLGFYIREGNGIDKWSGVFVSRIAQGSVVAKNNLLQVNDEILSVNMVDVQKMSLDDVVILMSIAKRLVLTVKVNNHLRVGMNSPHTEVISPREQAQRDGRQPIVVIKSGFNSSYNKDMPVDDKRQERIMEEDMEKQLVRRDVRDVYGTLPRYNVPMQQTFSQNYFPKQAFMLGIRSQKMPSFSPNPLEYRSELDYLYPKNLPFQYMHPQNQLQLEQQKLQQFHQQQQPLQEPMLHRRATSDQLFGTLDHSLPYHIQMEWFDQGLLASQQQQAISKDLGYRRPISQFTRVLPNGAISNIDQYSSDSEITPRYQKSRNKYRGFYQPRGMADLEMNQFQTNYSLSRSAGLTKNKLSEWGSFADLSSLSLYEGPQGMPNYPQTHFNVPLPQKDYNTWLDQRLLQQFSNEQSLMSTSVSKPVLSHATQMLQSKGTGMQPQFQATRLTRKLSTDSLLDYNIYKMEDSKNDLTTSQKSDNRLGSWISSSDAPYSKPSRSSSASKQKSQFSHSLSRHKQNTSLSSSTSNSLSSNKINTHLVSNSSKNRSGQLSRMPLKIQMEDFMESPSIDLSENSPSLTGLLRVNVLCSYGLKSTKTALRDLYCVIEVNSMPVARTTVRTGALNFDWNEDFDFEVCKIHKMQLLLYSWDLDSKHQLCFTASTPIAHVIYSQLQKSKKQKTQESKNIEKTIFPIKLAIKLEAKGILYTEISFLDSNVMFSRKKTNKKNGVFGAELKEVVSRERSGLSVPLLVQRCVREVENRGLSQLGVYRLSGSNKRKQQLREDLEKNPKLVDLSSDGVSDVNVITGVLKDYFKELPEPLCTTSLHEMLLDALSVQVPGDVEGNTQLMLGILECLPRVNQDTLAFMLDHLKKVSNNCETNKMTTEQIGQCLGPCLICPPPLDDSPLPSDLLQKHAQLLQCLLDIWQQEAPLLTTDQANTSKGQEDTTSSI